MIKTVFLVALLSIISLSFAADVEESVKSYHRPCPCKCFVKHREYLAVRQCKRKVFLYRCEVSECTKTKKHGYHPIVIKGKQCCDVIPVTPTPTPSVSPTPSPKVVDCPCKCVGKRKAVKQCYYLPHCIVTKCLHGRNGYGYRKRFECCKDHEYVPDY